MTGNSNTTAMWAHLGALLTWLVALIVFAPLSLFCFVTPLVIRTTHRDDSLVQHHTAQALNSAITAAVILLSAGLFAALMFLGGDTIGIIGVVAAFLVALGAGVGRVVCEIIGAVKAYQGERFTFPVWLAFRFVRDSVY